MTTILAIGALAVAAVKAYSHLRSNGNGNPENTPTIHTIRQSTSVVLAVAEAIWAVLDALIYLTKPRTASAQAGVRPAIPFGQRAADVAAEA